MNLPVALPRRMDRLRAKHGWPAAFFPPTLVQVQAVLRRIEAVEAEKKARTEAAVIEASK